MSTALQPGDSIRKLPGIGPVSGAALEKAGFFSVQDLLSAFPVSYRDYTRPARLAEAKADETRFFRAVIAERPAAIRRPGGLHILKLTLTDEEESIRAGCTIFNQPYLAANLHKGQTVFVDGTPRSINGKLTFSAPSLLIKPPQQVILPVYRNVSGITPARFRRAVQSALAAALDADPFSDAFLARYDVMALGDAYRGIHAPRTMAEQERARRRFALENALVTTRILDLVGAETALPSDMIISAPDYIESYLALQPLRPTQAQLRSMREIARDLESGTVMNRLLEGDVGSGKTLVAFFAMYAAGREGYQSILMAPTEVLARQHARAAGALFGEEKVALLTGSQKAAERQKETERIRRGEVPYIIGTHALLYDVVFHRPALLVTDEQQRFGVQQRRRLLGNDSALHSLVMSATPIPRSLSLALNGITQMSVLDELPPGRTPVTTRFVRPAKEKAMFDYMAAAAREGVQIYVVCPLIEDSGTLKLHAAGAVCERLKKTYPDVTFGLLHGRMDAAQKREVMADFAAGNLSVLVSTTVIEVGVDVPNAAMMIILDAERFGLAQLHQLRGRVGRGTKASWCFLCSAAPQAQARLDILCRTSDGFEVAEADMRERGVGEFLGWQQSGRLAPDLDIQEPWMIRRFHEMLNAMAADPALRGDFLYVARQAEARIADRLDKVALN